MNENTKDIKYWKSNCEDDFFKTPISVLRYISELEEIIKTNAKNKIHPPQAENPNEETEIH